MATRRRLSTTATSNIIDLTLDDDTATESTGNHQNSFPLRHQPSSTHLAAPNGIPPSFIQTGRSEDVAHPLKRQRTDEPVEDQEHHRRHYLAALLGKCLEQQIFPHIERATDGLPAGVYDIEKIGGKVIRTLVDKDFERYFNEGNGRLEQSRELIIAAGIPRLVAQLAASPDYRLSPANPSFAPSPAATNSVAPVTVHATPSSATTPVILPSIEKQVDHSNNNNNKKKNNNKNSNGDDVDDFDDLDADVGAADVSVDRDGDYGDDEGDYDSADPGYGLDAESDDERYESERPAAVHTTPKRRPPKVLVTPQQARTRAKASQWQSGKAVNLAPAQTAQPRSFGLPLRPYIPALERRQIIAGVGRAFLPPVPPSHAFHVDFNDAEINYLQQLARVLYGKPAISNQRSTLRDLRNILKKVPDIKNSLAEAHAKGYVDYETPPLTLRKRSSIDITNFLNDLYAKRLNSVPRCLFVEESNAVSQSEVIRANKIPAMLLSREITGNRLGTGRTYQNFITTVKSNREDYLEPQVEWADCAGDIMTVSWLSNDHFVCGTTTHSDSHNQQYNKPGNLLFGSSITHTLRAYPDHRILRPVVSIGDNALDSMVASQDPWLFTSVVSSDYDPSCGLAFTSSFDKTVKVWKPENDSMIAIGTWDHGGNVNFVVASKNGQGTIATAADVPTEAVRVYHLDSSNISSSPYHSYSCTRVHDEDYVPSEKWAYYPAAIRWGLAPEVQHLLLIGYSPRSPTGEDHEIPEEKRNSGELCLWNTITKAQVKVNSAKTQNVFEVVWHPSRASFAAATSASQVLEKIDQIPRTQIRIFEANRETGHYGAIKTLDCAAIDINELSIMPNSLLYSYVAAGCTDGKVYVWDTAASDWPMCVLRHGDPVEELLGERELEDVGVKFMTWATTADRLYTGSSDGVVKVWNIRHGAGVLMKDLVEATAPITYGTFSPDFTKLVIGDGSGRVYLLALEDPEMEDDPEPNPTNYLQVQMNDGGQRTIRRPRFVQHHGEIPLDECVKGQEIGREFLRNAQLVLHTDRAIGAVQGINYTETGLFRKDAHVNDDENAPLLPIFQTKQQECQPTPPIQMSLRQPVERDGLVNGWHNDPNAHPSNEEISLDGDDDNEQFLNSQDIFDHATWLELKKEKAELDDRLIEFDYETSIADSDEDDDVEL
ncbi:WD40 repeat-like protein [Xylaria venustula]|nr:WD40 repeat-like protein [Xylaria venustula]